MSEEFKVMLQGIFSDVENCSIFVTPKEINISISNMYSAPTLNFDTLLKLSEMFGTTSINVDDFSNEGCETCDYGSEYGHNLQIMKATKMIEECQRFAGHYEMKLWERS